VVNSLACGLRAHHAGTRSKVCGVFISTGPSHEEKRQKYEEARKEEVLT
jgi:hypothetical protein